MMIAASGRGIPSVFTGGPNAMEDDDVRLDDDDDSEKNKEKGLPD